AQMYYLHNYTFGLAGALMAGDGRLAVKYADHAEVAFPAGFNGAIALPAGLTRAEKPADRRATAQARSLVALGRYAPARALALAAGKPADAAREARASLKDWPADALALRVLSQAEAKLGDTKGAQAHAAEARGHWRGDLAKVPLALT